MDGQRRFAVIGTDALAGGGRPGAGPCRVCGGRAGADGTGRLHLTAAAAGREPHPVGGAAAGRKTGGAGVGRKALGAGKADRGGGGRGAGGLLCPGGTDPLQRHPDSRGLHRHPDGGADADALEQRHPAGRFWAGGAGAWGTAGGIGRTGDGGQRGGRTQRALAESFGLRAVDLARLEQTAPAFDTVVNTIPAPVLTEAVLAALRPGSLIVDLASSRAALTLPQPGGWGTGPSMP